MMECLNCLRLQAENKRLRDLFTETMGNVGFIAEEVSSVIRRANEHREQIDAINA